MTTRRVATKSTDSPSSAHRTSTLNGYLDDTQLKMNAEFVYISDSAELRHTIK